MIATRGARAAVAELLLGMVSLTVVYGFSRLFSEGGWAVPLVAAVLLAHLSGALTRRLGLGVVVQVVITALGMTLLAAWSQAPETLRVLLPTGDTFAAFDVALSEAASLFGEVRAPTEPITGFILAAMFGVAITATVADIAAFRLGAEIQALIPPLAVFVFCAVFGSGENRLVVTALFALAGLGFVLFMRNKVRASATWLPGDADRGPNALLRVGGTLAVTASVAALLVGPTLPGADQEAMWTWRGGERGDERIVLSPLVDIRARLVNQSSEVAFTVQSPEGAYWRLMALDEFDGQTFRLASSFRLVDGGVGGEQPGPDDSTLVQEFVIQGLFSSYLPGAFEVRRIDGVNDPVRWDDQSQTLLLDRDEAGRNFRYWVTSVVPDHDPDQLRAVSSQVPASIAERYLQLPELDPQVVALAQELVADAPTRFDQALALQTFFREEFTYSIDVSGGHSESALTTFLLESRIGFCEQFAASFAALARSIGIPARVAVGFTPGERSRFNPNLYIVRGEHAHAWPEVWFPDGIGWVSFEPTPGRGDPRAQRHTGLAPDQSGGFEEPGAPSTTAAPEQATTTFDLDEMLGFLGDELLWDIGAGAGSVDSGGSTSPLIVAVGALSASVAAWMALVALGVSLRRRIRRGRARGDAALVSIAWDEFVDGARSLGLTPRASETYREFADRVAKRVPEHRRVLDKLVVLAEAARFAPPASTTGEDLETATAASATLSGALRSLQTGRHRAKRLFDPRRATVPRDHRTKRRTASISLPMGSLPNRSN